MTCILQIGPLTERFNRGLAAEHEVLRFWEEGADALVNQHAQRIDVVVTSGRFGCTAQLIERLPNLQAIISFGVGYDAIDVAAARARRASNAKHIYKHISQNGRPRQACFGIRHGGAQL